MTHATFHDDSTQDVDATFIKHALDEADVNALRMALYQATGDESLIRMRLQHLEAHGGATTLTTLAPEHHEEVKDKMFAFIRAGGKAGKIPNTPELRRMMEAMLGRPLSEKEFVHQKQLLAFDDFPYAADWHAGKRVPEGFRVAIIGAGISGIVTGIHFQRLGIPYTLYERRHEIGGTWSINNYPDVRVDTTNFVYQFSFEKNYPWSEHFCRQVEVKRYLEHVARKYGVFDNIVFDTDVTKAVWDEKRASWSLTLGDERQAQANVVVAATGLFGVPKRLDAPGVESFAGDIVHTTDWSPDMPLRGRKVAIIGNGSTGVQLLSKVAAQAEKVTVFQRTPQWISPRERYGEPVSAEMRWLLDNVPHYWNWSIYSLSAMGLSHQPVQEIDREWQSSGGLISECNDGYRAGLTHYIESELGERTDLIEKVTPKHAPMARRLIVDNGWYKSLLRDNVELVTESIERITPSGVQMQDGKLREFDLIISATGFQTTKYAWPTEYDGANGANLHERWEREGTPRAYLGLAVPDFPNLFFLYGPNSQPRAGSLISWQEIWSRYCAQAIVDLLESGHRAMTVRHDVYEEYNRRMDAAAEDIVWNEPLAKARNYYVDSSGRSSVNAPWRMEDFYQFFVNQSLDDYELLA
jgi:4-hydroxyacetophenone monooxygenase